jgi:signal peptidase I
MTKRATIWVAAIVGAAAVLAGLVVASGMRFYTVMTPSMGQVAPVGTLVVTHPAESYVVGDIVTYERKDRSYTHRIVTANADGTFITKGDLNGAPDALPVAQSQIVGRVVWIGPGLGWLWQALPWLGLGFLLVFALSLLKMFGRTLRWVVRISGWTMVFCAVALWLRPWVSLTQLTWAPSGAGGVDMHVVNTGLFPLDVLGTRLLSGQDAVVHVTQIDARGYFTLTPGLAFTWWEQVGLFLLCLIPLALSFLVRDEDAVPPTRALADPRGDEFGDEQTDPADQGAGTPAPTGKRPGRRRLILTGAVTLAIIASVAVVTFTTTSAALTAKVTNSANTAGTRTYFTCANAVSSSASPVPYLAWAASTDANTTSYFFGLGGTTQADLSGSGRTARYTSAQSRTTISADGSSFGCLRDNPTASVTFTGSNGGYCLAQYGNVSNSNKPQTFSVEAWFKTSSYGTGQGKIIGFGTGQTTADDDGNYDRHIYLDKDGRIVFGVYPNAVKIVYTPAGKNYADSKWHHVVGTLSPSGTEKGLRLYVDGALADSDTSITSAQDYTGYWKVGCGKLGSWQNASTAASGNTGSYDFSGSSYFTGQIQYASVYTVALTAAQVSEHYLAGAA